MSHIGHTELEAAVSSYRRKTDSYGRRLRAALIDMDGTLYDSMKWHAKAWHRMVTEIGIEATEDEFFQYEGMTGKATVNLLFRRAGRGEVDDETVTELYGRKAAFFREMYTPTLMPGALQMVETFRRFDMETVLVTGSAQASVLDRVNVDYPGFFPPNRCITAKDVVKGKPSPEPYLKGLELCGIAPVEAIVVENAPLGVEAGVKAGIFTVGVKTGPLPLESLYSAGADIVFESMTRCAEMLPELLLLMNTFSNKQK